MSYLKTNFTLENDYIAIRADCAFAINFTNNSNFANANVKVYKAFTTALGEIGLSHKVNKVDGAGAQIVYSAPCDAVFGNSVLGTWIIFQVTNVHNATNIEITLNIPSDNPIIKSNNLIITPT